MKQPFAVLPLLVLALTACTSPATVAEEPPAQTPLETSTAAAVEKPQGSPSATPLKDFEERVDKYISIRNNADDHTPPLTRTDDPAKIKEAQDALAQRIRGLLVNAKHGDTFTPEISAYFRRLLRPEVKDKGTKETIQEDNPGIIPYLKVSAVYPEDEPLSTVPPNVLATLPPLPKDIEYRFVGRHLILRDSRANLIIDYVPNAIP